MQMDGYIKTLVASDIAILKMATVHDIISANQLWEPLAKHMMVIAGKLFESSEQLSPLLPMTSSARSLMSCLMRIPASEIILPSSPISVKNASVPQRRDAHPAGLKRGYIEMQRGVLINIVKLPEKY